MKTCYKTICLSLSIAMMSSTAFADKLKSEICAVSLSPTGKTIYEAVAPSVEADSDIKALLKKKVRPLVMSGTLARKDVKQNVPMVGKCLHLLKEEKQTTS